MSEKIRYTELKPETCGKGSEHIQGVQAAYGRKEGQSDITVSSDQWDCGRGLARSRAGVGVFAGISANSRFAHLLISAATAIRCHTQRAGANSRVTGRRHHAGASISDSGALAATGPPACQSVDAGRGHAGEKYDGQLRTAQLSRQQQPSCSSRLQ